MTCLLFHPKTFALMGVEPATTCLIPIIQVPPKIPQIDVNHLHLVEGYAKNQKCVEPPAMIVVNQEFYQHQLRHLFPNVQSERFWWIPYRDISFPLLKWKRRFNEFSKIRWIWPPKKHCKPWICFKGGWKMCLKSILPNGPFFHGDLSW